MILKQGRNDPIDAIKFSHLGNRTIHPDHHLHDQIMTLHLRLWTHRVLPAMGMSRMKSFQVAPKTTVPAGSRTTGLQPRGYTFHNLLDIPTT
jgi:hypothetical protein